MIIKKPSFKIIAPAIDADLYWLVERAGRVCYKSDDPDKLYSDEKSIRFIQNIIKNGHESVLEHASISVAVEIDRGVSHEWVRHRIAAYSQESTRYCNYTQGKFGKAITVIDIMQAMMIDPKVSKLPEGIRDIIYSEWQAAMLDAERHYFRMVELGASPQIARSVLPNSTKTELVATHDIREWRHIFKLRPETFAHPQMREIMIPILIHFKEWFPAFFFDIEVPTDVTVEL